MRYNITSTDGMASSQLLADYPTLNNHDFKESIKDVGYGYTRKIYSIDVAGLTDLMALIGAVGGQVVIGMSPEPNIEIYNDYRD